MSGLIVPAQRAGWRQPAATAVLVGLATITLYEAAVALEAIPMGEEPGENSFGADIMRLAGMVTLFAGVLVTLASVRSPEAISRRLRQLVPLAAAALVVATGYAFDPYFAPSLRRYVDGGYVAPAWLLFTVIAAVVTALLVRADAHTGMGATAALLLLCLGTVAVMGTGH